MRKFIFVLVLLQILVLYGCQREVISKYKEEISIKDGIITNLKLDMNLLNEENAMLIQKNDELLKVKEDLEAELLDSKEKEYTIDIEFSNEMKLWNGNTSDGVNITVEYGDMWKGEMEKYYDLLYKQLSGEGKEILVESQKKWEGYSETNNELKWKINDEVHKGGTIISIFSAYNYYERYRERAIFLKEEYDMLMFNY